MIDISYVSFLWIVFFFLFFVILISENHIHSKIKTKKISLTMHFFCYFSWFFLSILFILIFWFVSYKNVGISIANSNIILFFSSYLLELSLSIDNVFSWYLVFQTFSIPLVYQKKVLLYGIWGAVILRVIIIFFGKILLAKCYWFLYVFGMVFLITGLKMILFKDKEETNKKNIKDFWISKIFNITSNTHSEKFFFIIKNKLYLTPLFLSLIAIEMSDIMFSIDSIPAVFSITNNFFIIFTSNIFSIIGLRSMYFIIMNVIEKCFIIKYALSIILIFIGIKILIEKIFFISAFLSFLIILSILTITFFINVFLNFKKKI